MTYPLEGFEDGENYPGVTSSSIWPWRLWRQRLVQQHLDLDSYGGILGDFPILT
jgi:hypothetical protein